MVALSFVMKNRKNKTTTPVSGVAEQGYLIEMSDYPKGRATKLDLSKADVKQLWSDTGPEEFRTTQVAVALTAVKRAKTAPKSQATKPTPGSEATPAPEQVTPSPVSTPADKKAKLAKAAVPESTMAQAKSLNKATPPPTNGKPTTMPAVPSPVSALPVESTASLVKKAKVALVDKTCAVASHRAAKKVGADSGKAAQAAHAPNAAAAKATAGSPRPKAPKPRKQKEKTDKKPADYMVEARADDEKEGRHRAETVLPSQVWPRFKAFAESHDLTFKAALAKIVEDHLPANRAAGRN